MAGRFYAPPAEVPVTVYPAGFGVPMQASFARSPLPAGVGYANVNGLIVSNSTGYAAGGHYVSQSHMASRKPSAPPIIERVDGNNDEDKASSVANRGTPSTSALAQDLANEIERMETECNQLEGRNVWLTKRLMHHHKTCIEKTLLGNDKNRLRKNFEAWREAMQDMILEREINEQTMGLDQCQQVAQELGAALAQEQQARKTSEADHKKMQDDLQRAILQEKRLKDQFKEQQVQLELLEKRVQEAESCLHRSRADAESFVDSASEYDKRRREFESQREHDEGFGNRQPQSPLPNLRLREFDLQREHDYASSRS